MRQKNQDREQRNTSDVTYVFQDGLFQQKEIDHSAIPAGFYRFEQDPTSRNVLLSELSMPEQDRYVETGSEGLTIERDMKKFFQNSNLYNQMELAHRRGALMYGPPGTGKTYSIIRAARRCMEDLNILVFLIHEDVRFDDLAPLRPYFTDRRTVFVFEEISRRAMDRGRRASADLLSFLDGELSWDHNYNIATTNYPGDLPGNIVDRPGRFDVLIEMDVPGRSVRKDFLDAYLGTGNYPVDVVDRLEGFSIAYIKELILRSKLYDHSLAAVVDQFSEQKQKIKAAFDTGSENLGFGVDGNGRAS